MRALSQAFIQLIRRLGRPNKTVTVQVHTNGDSEEFQERLREHDELFRRQARDLNDTEARLKRLEQQSRRD